MKILRNPIYIFGLAILLTQIGVSWLSRSFVYGTGHAERPIIPFLILEFVSFGFYFAAIEWVRRLPGESGSQRKTIFWIVLIGILSRLVFLPSNLIQETDPYRYIWDGQTVLSGENPYEHSPEEAFQKRLAPAREVTPVVHETFGKINHSTIKTIYPPLAQYLFAVSQWLTPWNLMGWKLMILFAEVGIFILMLGMLVKLGMRKEWLVLYAWCPLVIKQFSNSLHLDVFAVFFLALMIFGLLSQRFYLGFVSLALATGVKVFPLVLVPLVFLWIKKTNHQVAGRGLGIFAIVLLSLYLPFLAAGGSLFEGLVKFAGAWRVNEGLFALLHLGVGEPASRITAGLIYLICLIAAMKYVNQGVQIQNLFQACLFVVASLFFLAPAGNPWYFTWVFPFLYFAPLRSLVIFSGLVFLYYLDFYFSYRSESHLFTWVKWVEYGIFYLIVIAELSWRTIQKSRLFCRWQTSGILSAAR